MKAKLLKTDGTIEDLELPDDDRGRYQAIQAAVQGQVEQLVLKSKKILYFNEDRNILGLPTNMQATKLAVLTIPIDTYILGNVVVVDPNIK